MFRKVNINAFWRGEVKISKETVICIKFSMKCENCSGAQYEWVVVFEHFIDDSVMGSDVHNNIFSTFAS